MNITLSMNALRSRLRPTFKPSLSRRISGFDELRGMSVVLALLSYHLFEIPIQNLRTKFEKNNNGSYGYNVCLQR